MKNVVVELPGVYVLEVVSINEIALCVHDFIKKQEKIPAELFIGYAESIELKKQASGNFIEVAWNSNRPPARISINVEMNKQFKRITLL